jgi:hypothetical protein
LSGWQRLYLGHARFERLAAVRCGHAAWLDHESMLTDEVARLGGDDEPHVMTAISSRPHQRQQHVEVTHTRRGRGKDAHRRKLVARTDDALTLTVED